MVITRFVVGELGTNSYCVKGENFALVIDPADRSEELLTFAKENIEKQDKYILLTHGHIDHILGVQEIKEIWNCPVVIGKKEKELLENPEYNLSRFISGAPFSLSADIFLSEGDELKLGDEVLKVLETPGHTSGSVCYILRDNMFSGDTLFKGTIGRTDFPTSNTMQMLSSLKRLSLLSTDYKLYPGHDEKTTLFYEKKFNNFLRF